MSINRVSGLSSGMDIDKTVSDLMKAQRAPLNKMLQKKSTMEWQRDGYRDMNTKITDYRNNKLSNYRLEGTFVAKKVEVTGNTTAVSGTATGDSQIGTLTIDVANLATAATNKSSGSIVMPTTTFDPTKALGTQDANLVGNFTTTPAGTFNIATFKINGTTITVDPNVDSLNDVIKRINQNTNVSAFYDSTSGQISFSAKNTGFVNGATNDQDKITFEDLNGGNFLATTFLVTTAAGIAGIKANVTINGLLTTRDSNTFKVNGLQVTLNAKTNGTMAILSTKTDTDKIVDSIKVFIKDYNDMLKTIQDKNSEAKYRDFPPLTDDQKKNMKDIDITNWEIKAKSGLLSNDSILSTSITNMRTDVINEVKTGDPIINTLYSIGIETGSYSENGKLYLSNESKLRAAIESNPDAVKSLFTAKGNGVGDKSDVGIAQRLYSDMKNTVDNLTNKAGFASFFDSSTRDGSLIGHQLFNLGKDIDAKNNQLKDRENRYYRQFSAMESAINRYNAQSASLASSFGQK